MPPSMFGTSWVRWTVTVALVVLALVLQVTLFPHLAPDGSGAVWSPTSACSSWSRPAWSAGPSRPPCSASWPACCSTSHLPPTTWPAAGRSRWSWSATSRGGCVPNPGSGDASSRPSATAVVATVAASSFVGTSVYAISGLLLQDPVVSVGDLLPVILAGVVWDVLLTPLVMPGLMRLFTALEPRPVRV